MDTVQQFDELDFTMESSAVVALEDMLSSLGRKMHEIETVGQISRSQAQLLVEQYAVNLESRCPINAFTQIPSTTNLRVAQEGIIETIADKIWELIQAAGNLLRRVWRWIIDFITFRKARDRQARQVAENVVAAHAAAQELKEKANLSPAEQVMREAAKDFDALYNGLTDDFLKSGKYIRMVRALQPGVASVSAAITGRVAFIIRQMDRMSTSLIHPTSVIGKDSVGLFDSTALRFYEPALKKADIPAPNNPKSAREWMQSALIEVTKENMAKLSPLEPNEAMRLFALDSNAIRDPLLLLPDEVARSVQKNLDVLDQIKRTKIKTANAEDQAIIQKLVQTTIDDAMSVQVFMSMLNLVATTRDKLVAALWKYSSFVYESCYNEAVTTEDPIIQKIVERNAAVLKAHLKRR